MSDNLSMPDPDYRDERPGRYGAGRGRARQGMNPAVRRLVIFAGALGVVLVSLIGASAIIGRHSTEVPVVIPDTRPVREKPVNPGGMKIEGADRDVLSAGTDIKNARLAPVAETPDTKALLPPAPASAVEATTADAPASATAIPKPVGPAPIGKSAIVTSAPPAPKPAAVKPASAATEAHAAPVAVDTQPLPAAHQPMVQLAALASEDAAHNEWQQMLKRMPDLLNGRQPSFQRTDRDGHTYWRVRTGGFTDLAQARGFCEHVRAKGGGCSVAEF